MPSVAVDLLNLIGSPSGARRESLRHSPQSSDSLTFKQVVAGLVDSKINEGLLSTASPTATAHRSRALSSMTSLASLHDEASVSESAIAAGPAGNGHTVMFDNQPDALMAPNLVAKALSNSDAAEARLNGNQLTSKTDPTSELSAHNPPLFIEPLSSVNRLNAAPQTDAIDLAAIYRTPVSAGPLNNRLIDSVASNSTTNSQDRDERLLTDGAALPGSPVVASAMGIQTRQPGMRSRVDDLNLSEAIDGNRLTTQDVASAKHIGKRAHAAVEELNPAINAATARHQNESNLTAAANFEAEDSAEAVLNPQFNLNSDRQQENSAGLVRDTLTGSERPMGSNQKPFANRTGQPTDPAVNAMAGQPLDNLASSSIHQNFEVDAAAQSTGNAEKSISDPLHFQSASSAASPPITNRNPSRDLEPESSRLTQTEGQLSVDGQVDGIMHDASLNRATDHRLEHNDDDVFNELLADEHEATVAADDQEDRMANLSEDSIGTTTQTEVARRHPFDMEWGDRLGALITTQAGNDSRRHPNEMSQATAIPYDRFESTAAAEQNSADPLMLEALLQGDGSSETLQETTETLFRAAERSMRAGGTSMQLELHPPELGMLKVSVTQVDQRIETHIIATELVTSELLNQHRDQLLQTLSEMGFDSSEVDISHQQHDGERERFGDEHTGKRHQNQSAVPRTEFAEPDTNPANSTTNSGLNIVA